MPRRSSARAVRYRHPARKLDSGRPPRLGAGQSLQPDLYYRGFSTSPLLGAGQELSVYEDGVRVNDLVLPSLAHPEATFGEIAVEPGDFLPGVPRHQLRASLDGPIGRRLHLGGIVRHDSSRYLRGDEANLLAPIPAATVGDLWLEVSLPRGLELALRVTNVTDQEYATFGALGEADEVLSPDFDDPRFVTPAEPRAGLLTLRVLLDRQD